jgi:hypothetical protein
VISEYLSDASVPVLLMDIKGDLSGIAAMGAANEKVTDGTRKSTCNIPQQHFRLNYFDLPVKTVCTFKGHR